MKHILITTIIFLSTACGGGSGGKSTNINELPVDEGGFTLHNIRFDSKDFYEGEQVTVSTGTRFDVQWVSPSSASYRIDLYLSTNGEVHSDTNKIVGLRCGSTSFSLCPNATGEVQCEVDDNTLSCFAEVDSLGGKPFQDEDLSSLRFIIKGCDALNNCDVKTFDLLVQNISEEV
tara:strand:- start:253 stop:777 length:525 start_codon:yes stop_codon:yes gene_type:complete